MRKYTVLFYTFLAFCCGVTNVAFASCPAGQYLGYGGISLPLSSNPDYTGWVSELEEDEWIPNGAITNGDTTTGYSITMTNGYGGSEYYYESGDTIYLNYPDGSRTWIYPGTFVVAWTTHDVLGVAIGYGVCSDVSLDNTYANPNRTVVFTDRTGGGLSSPDTGTPGPYCWCKIKSWNGQELGSEWVEGQDYGSVASCRDPYGCIYDCATAGITGWSNGLNTPGNPYNWNPFGGVRSCVACPAGSDFYTGTTGNTAPTVDNGSISSYTTWSYQDTEITNCYAKPNTRFHDERGSFKYNSNCYYTK